MIFTTYGKNDIYTILLFANIFLFKSINFWTYFIFIHVNNIYNLILWVEVLIFFLLKKALN